MLQSSGIFLIFRIALLLCVVAMVDSRFFNTSGPISSGSDVLWILSFTLIFLTPDSAITISSSSLYRVEAYLVANHWWEKPASSCLLNSSALYFGLLKEFPLTMGVATLVRSFHLLFTKCQTLFIPDVNPRFIYQLCYYGFNESPVIIFKVSRTSSRSEWIDSFSVPLCQGNFVLMRVIGHRRTAHLLWRDINHQRILPECLVTKAVNITRVFRLMLMKGISLWILLGFFFLAHSFLAYNYLYQPYWGFVNLHVFSHTSVCLDQQ